MELAHTQSIKKRNYQYELHIFVRKFFHTINFPELNVTKDLISLHQINI